jgi:hypothetical protein
MSAESKSDPFPTLSAMNPRPDELPSHLMKAVRERHLLIFVGAGLSMLPPSSLPDWWQFNEMLLNEARNAALQVEGVGESGATALRSLTLDDVGIVAQSEAIVKIIAGDGYFPVLQVLDSNRANDNHRALADLAARQIVRVIVTTNFDTLIEQAFAEAGVPLVTAICAADFIRTRDPGICTLYKIHGSVTQSTSLTDTVGQKLRGLTPFARNRLAELFREFHVLVAGYSGKDLDFGSDYLSFAAIDASSRGITWLERVEGKPKPRSPRLEEVIARAGSRGTFHSAILPEFFQQLGVSVKPTAESSFRAGSGSIDKLVGASIGDFFKVIGSHRALAFCMRLLLDAGKSESGRLLRDVLIAAVDALGENLPDTEGPVLRALAVTAQQIEGVAGVERWTLRELRFLERQLQNWHPLSQQVKARLQTQDGQGLAHVRLPHPFQGVMNTKGWDAVNQQVVTELERLQAGAWGNLALQMVLRGDLPGASHTIIRAMDFCELSASPIELFGCYLAYATGLLSASSDPAGALHWLTFAEAAGVLAGNVDAANASALQRAQALVALGEYDLALARVRSRFPLEVNREVEVEVGRIAGGIELRRGQLTSAHSTWQQALQAARESSVLRGRVGWTMITELSFLASERQALAQECEVLLREMSAGRLPKNGAIQGIPPVEAVQQWQLQLRKEGPDGEPSFTSLDFHGSKLT